MKNLYTTLIVLFIGSVFSNANAQCDKANKIASTHKKEGWAESTQSRAGVLQAGKEYEMTFVAQANMEYLLTFATNNEAVNEQINYLVYEKVVVKTEENGKKVYRKVDNVLYDSREHEFALETEFLNRKSRKLYLRVSVPVKDDKKENHCIGVLIEQKKTQQLGLN